MTASSKSAQPSTTIGSTDLDQSYAWCKSLTKRTAGNFYSSFHALPRERFREMCVLYAFMRISDDLGDEGTVPNDQRAEMLTRWRKSVEGALSGEQFDHPLLSALGDVVERRSVPHEHLFAVIDGIATDLDPQGFETFEELTRYCYHVAGAVGLCCIHIWGFHDERAIGLAVDCGVAFQITNILRDLAEDMEMGRVYLPREDLRRFEYTEQDIAAHRHDERFERLMQFEVDRARGYFCRAEELSDYLDPAGKPIFRAMLRIYGGLLNEIERRNFDVYSGRVTLPRWRKLLITLDAIVRRRWLR